MMIILNICNELDPTGSSIFLPPLGGGKYTPSPHLRDDTPGPPKMV